jgi:glycosyltransferase involved in cell wall biosynthesis
MSATNSRATNFAERHGALGKQIPKVSFIVPAFNEEGSLPECLASLRSSGVASFEILVVDNNSTDGTAAIAKDLCDRVIPCAIQGIAAARNEGARHANGEFLAFIDADARVASGWLDSALSLVSRSGVVTGWNYFREKNPILSLYFNCYCVVFFVLQMVSVLIGSSVVAGNNLLIRRDLFEQSGGFPCYVGEDVKLAKILASHKVSAELSLGMRIGYSSRRFRKQGFLRTMRLWILSVFSDIPEHDYRLDYTKS